MIGMIRVKKWWPLSFHSGGIVVRTSLEGSSIYLGIEIDVDRDLDLFIDKSFQKFLMIHFQDL